jgi:predicted transcriptional regulator
MTFTPEDNAESRNSTVSAAVVPSGTSNETTAVMELPGLIRTLDALAQTAAMLSGLK